MKYQKYKKGYTLTEVIVAIAIFSLGVLGIFSFFAFATQITRSARNTTTATNLAQGVMDRTLNNSYTAITTGEGSPSPYSPDQSSPYHKYETQVNVFYLDTNLNQTVNDVGFKEIDVFVYWNEGTTQKNVSLKSIVSKK